MTVFRDPADHAELAARVERATQPWLTSLDAAGAAEVTHLAAHGEAEMALESFLLSAMEFALPFTAEQKRELLALCLACDLQRDAVLSADFWQRASVFLGDHG